VAILIDCGCSSKYIIKNLNYLNITPQNIKAAFITHAHSDHISTPGINFLHNNDIPIYLHQDIYSDILKKHRDKIEKCNIVPFYKSVEIENIFVQSFDVHHKDKNISHTLGFTFSSTINERKYKIGYLTDTGKVCDKIIKNLVNSNILIIESNYNKTILNSSFRTYNNKKWILSEKGHLSNEDAANAIYKIRSLSTSKDSLKYVFLAHISKHHNTNSLAIKTSKKLLLSKNIHDVKLFITKRNQKCPTIRIN
jgi:phosphoribosyl 1,2-cyclic phosphodiesterase